MNYFHHYDNVLVGCVVNQLENKFGKKDKNEVDIWKNVENDLQTDKWCWYQLLET